MKITDLRRYEDFNGNSYLISDYRFVENRFIDKPFNCNCCGGTENVVHDTFKIVMGKLEFNGRICDKCLDNNYMEVIFNGTK